MMTIERSTTTKLVNFMTPGQGMMTTKGSIKIVNFMNPGAGILVLRHGHFSKKSEYALSSTLSIYSTLIAIVLRYFNAAFLCHCGFKVT